MRLLKSRRIGYVISDATPDDRAFQRWATAQYEKAAVFAKDILNTQGFLSVASAEESLIRIWLLIFEKVAPPLVYLREEWGFLPYDERMRWHSPEDKAMIQAETKKVLEQTAKIGFGKTATTAEEPTPESIFPPGLLQDLIVEVRGEAVLVTPKTYLGSEKFGDAIRIVREYGGEYVSAGKDSHFRIPRPIRKA